MDLAELTRQLAKEAGVDLTSVAASLERHASTREVGTELRRQGTAEAPPATQERGELAPRADATPARRRRQEGGAGGSGGPLSVAWWQEPIVYFPAPWRPGTTIGVSPLLFLVAWFAWRAWKGQPMLPDFLRRAA